MDITYKETKDFSSKELEELFLSVGWLSGHYPDRLAVALKNSSTVISAWEGTKLVGLANVLDDNELTAYMHYLLVHSEYHHAGIGCGLISRIKEKYKNYLYLVLIAEDKNNITFYQQYGFEVTSGATPMHIMKR